MKRRRDDMGDGQKITNIKKISMDPGNTDDLGSIAKKERLVVQARRFNLLSNIFMSWH